MWFSSLPSSAETGEEEMAAAFAVGEGQNSSAFFVPRHGPGSALLHDHRVMHGVAPVTKGSKYSLLFFLDMPPERPPKALNATFVHAAPNAPPVKLVWAHSPDFNVKREILEAKRTEVDDWALGKSSRINSFPGHKFEVLPQDPELLGNLPLRIFSIRDETSQQTFRFTDEDVEHWEASLTKDDL